MPRGGTEDSWRQSPTLEETFATDCVNSCFVKRGRKSQREAIDKRYSPFALEFGLPTAQLPTRPSTKALVHLAVRVVQSTCDEDAP